MRLLVPALITVFLRWLCAAMGGGHHAGPSPAFGPVGDAEAVPRCRDCAFGRRIGRSDRHLKAHTGRSHRHPRHC